jgi:hypothetical protein
MSFNWLLLFPSTSTDPSKPLAFPIGPGILKPDLHSIFSLRKMLNVPEVNNQADEW